MQEYKTVEKEASDFFIEKKSKFIGYAKPVKTQEDTLEFISKIKSKHWDATHNVYAYVLRENNIQRYSDDGEPQGTAGQPMLEVLRKQGLRHVLAVVTRYFGGVKLGAGGLVCAYTKSVTDALKKAEIVKYKPSVTFFVETDYACLKGLKREIASLSETEADVRKTISEATLGSAKVSVSDETQICYQIK